MTQEKKLIIDTKDYRDVRVIFTFDKWQEKSVQHPELQDKTFLKNLKETIENPEEVWQDNNDKKHKLCYYRKYSTVSYVKVVIWITAKFCEVVTAYEIDKIKEVKYPKLKRLK